MTVERQQDVNRPMLDSKRHDNGHVFHQTPTDGSLKFVVNISGHNNGTYHSRSKAEFYCTGVTGITISIPVLAPSVISIPFNNECPV